MYLATLGQGTLRTFGTSLQKRELHLIGIKYIIDKLSNQMAALFPSRNDFEKLNEQVAELTEQITALQSQLEEASYSQVKIKKPRKKTG